MHAPFILILALAAGAACASAEGVALGKPVVDTLPGGAVRVTNATPSAWRDSSSGWRIVEELRITGEPGTESEIINPQSLALDAEGRIWVVDQKPARIKVFGRDGRLVRLVGREGAGPGEFRVGFIAPAGGFMVVHDPRVARTNVFDTAGGFIRSWPSQCCYWTPIRVDRAGQIYIPGVFQREEQPEGTPYIRYRLDGTAADTLFAPRAADPVVWTVRAGAGSNRMMFSTSVPFTPTMQSAVDPDGGFVAGHTSSYELAVMRSAADTARLFGRAWTPEPVSDAERQDTVEARIAQHRGPQVPEEALRAVFKVGDVPGTRPAFNSVSADQAGYYWVGLGGSRYDVFGPGGAWLGEVRLPVTAPPWQIYFGLDRIAAFLEDEGGTPTVVVLRVDRGGTTSR